MSWSVILSEGFSKEDVKRGWDRYSEGEEEE